MISHEHVTLISLSCHITFRRFEGERVYRQHGNNICSESRFFKYLTCTGQHPSLNLINIVVVQCACVQKHKQDLKSLSGTRQRLNLNLRDAQKGPQVREKIEPAGLLCGFIMQWVLSLYPALVCCIIGFTVSRIYELPRHSPGEVVTAWVAGALVW